MGGFDDIEDLGKVIGDLVDVGDAPQGPTAQAPPSSPGPLGRLQKAVKGAAGSEILDAGQLLIAGMRLTTGWGEPERGEPFGHGSARFTRAGETVGSAAPREDWQGAGADAYSGANRRQARDVASLAVLDRSVQTVIAREAYQVGYHRDNLDDQSDYLGDLSYATWSIGLIPGVGKAMKAAFELAAVTGALTVCSFELDQLSEEVGENATQLQELAGEYSTLTQRKAAPPSLGDEPPAFDDPPVPGPTDRRGPGQPVPAASPGAAPTSPPRPTSSPGAASSPAAAAAASPGPACAPAPSADLCARELATAAQPATPPPVPADAMSGMTSAFGAVGGAIGSVVAPLAAVLTGVAAAAGQSLSMLADGGSGADTGDAPTDENAEPTRERGTEDEPVDDAGMADGPGAGEGAIPEDVAAEPEGSPPPPADSLEPAPPPAPPAATRPPQ